MVNASLNWASIVGIVLAVGGALLYFLRSFRPALARDYDVFFAAVGLLCGGILFFQGWRLDPILQFGQFLLAGCTVFFAYESVRLRGIATEQAKRATPLVDEDRPVSRSYQYQGDYDDYDRFEDRGPSRRIRGGMGQGGKDDFEEYPYRRELDRDRRSRPAIDSRSSARDSGRYSPPGSGWGDEFDERPRTPRPERGDRRRRDDFDVAPAPETPILDTPPSTRPEPPAASPRRLSGASSRMPRSARRPRGSGEERGPVASRPESDRPAGNADEPYVDFKPLPPLGNVETDNSNQFDD
jgi:hypothetical protein